MKSKNKMLGGDSVAIKYLGYAMIGFMGLILLASLWGTTFGVASASSEDLYAEAANRVEHFESGLRLAKVNLCEVERDLAKTKLKKHYNEETVLEENEVDRLTTKSRQSCDFL